LGGGLPSRKRTLVSNRMPCWGSLTKDVNGQRREGDVGLVEPGRKLLGRIEKMTQRGQTDVGPRP